MIWKTLAGRCIYRGLNDIKVQQNFTYRWLTLGSDAIQTLIHRRHPERSGLQYIPALTMAARTIPGESCLLGLGGAGVAHALGNARLDAVECSHEVIEIAASYFMTGQIKNLDIIHQDALVYVEDTKNRYQHLMVDLFNANSFPDHCNNTDFFAHCKRVLLSNGVLAVNLANMHEQWPVFKLISEQFPQCTVSVPVKGTSNMVVLAYNGESIKALLSMLESQSGLKRMIWDTKWGCVAELKS